MTTQAAVLTNDAADAGASLARFIQCRVPAPLYEWMRLQGGLLNSIVLEALAAYQIELAARGGAPGAAGAPRQATRDGGPQVMYNVRLDTATYAWLRATAVHAHTSINALVGAALIQAQAAH